MKMSKLTKVLISLQLAILLILPVNANDSLNSFNSYLDIFPYFVVDSSGCIIISSYPMCMVPISNTSNAQDWNYMNYFPSTTAGSTERVKQSLPYIILTPIYSYSDGETLIVDYSYKYYYHTNDDSANGKWIVYDTTTCEWSTLSSIQKYVTGTSTSNAYSNLCIGFYYPSGANFVYVQTANYQVGVYNDSITLYTNNVYDTDLKLTDYLSTHIQSQDIVYNIYNEVNNISNLVNDIINMGSGYPLPSGGDELNSAQTALSEAEGAISDKASSIKDQVSGQVQSNLELAASSVDKVKQDSVQIKQLYATVTSSLPDEVKLLFVVVPLLLFVGWLIGRVRQ